MKPKPSFESAMQDLEKIVNQLEKGELPLEEALNLFKEGVELTKYCNQKLEDAERKITICIQQENGQLVEEEFSEGE